MIKSISTGIGLRAINNYSVWPTFYNSPASTGNTLIGQVRYNGSSQHMEVYDGTSWLIMTGTYPTIELSGEVQTIIDWARTKMSDEARLTELAAKHPIVADAMAAVDQAQEQVRIVVALVEPQ